MELIKLQIWWHFNYNETPFTTATLGKALQEAVKGEVWHNFISRNRRNFDFEQQLEIEEIKVIVLFRLSEDGGSIESIALLQHTDEDQPNE